MKKFYLLLMLVFLAIGASNAQELAVKSFKRNEKAIYAKTKPRFDNNDNACALVRVFSTIENLTIDGNLGHIGQIDNSRPAEYWIYLPIQTKRLIINHPNYLPYTFTFNKAMQEYATYELVLEPSRSKPSMNMQYLSLTVTPADAIVLIDDIPHELTHGTLALKLPFGVHTYSISSSSHHIRKGTFEISEKGTTELAITLVEAMGTLVVDASPAEGAKLLIDGKMRGKTPCEVHLPSGSHYIQVIKDGYAAYSTTLNIEDGKTSKLSVELTSKSAEVTLKAAHAHSEIWIDGKQRGEGTWRGNLLAGAHTIETRTDGYETIEETLIVEEGHPLTLNLKAPDPIYCMLEVTSNPMGAEILLDGKHLGKTPYMSNEISAGTHQIELQKEGYKTHMQSVNLRQERHNTVHITLPHLSSTSVAESKTAQSPFFTGEPQTSLKTQKVRGFQHALEFFGGYLEADQMAFSLNWIGGYRFGHYFFLGGGAGVSFVESGDEFFAPRLFIQPKVYFSKTKVAPYLSALVGTCINATDGELMLIATPEIGIDIKMGKRSLGVGAGVDLYLDTDSEYLIPQLKIGLTF